MSVSTKIERLRHENETLRSTVEKLNSEVEYGMHASVEQDGEIASLRAQLAERDAKIERLRTQAGLDSSQREDELRAQLAEANRKIDSMMSQFREHRAHDLAKHKEHEAALAQAQSERDDFRAGAAAEASAADRARKDLAQAQAEAGAMREAIEKARRSAYDAPELNMSNYTEDEVSALNAGMIETFLILDAALSSAAGRSLLERVRRMEAALVKAAADLSQWRRTARALNAGEVMLPLSADGIAETTQILDDIAAALREEDSE